MVTTPRTEARSSNGTKDALTLLISLLLMAGVMAAYWLYPYPSGNRPDIWDFLTFFFREALLLAFFGVVGLIILMMASANAIRRMVKRIARNDAKAP